MNVHRVIYIIGSAAPPIFDIEQLLRLLQERGWQPCLILTATAASWIDAPHGGEILGCPVRVDSRQPGEAEPLPPADAVLAAPLTFNSANKWAAGINDTLALGVLNELLCEEVPIIVAPCVKATLQQHPAYRASLSRLEYCGAHILNGENVIKRKDDSIKLSWPLVIDAIESVTHYSNP